MHLVCHPVYHTSYFFNFFAVTVMIRWRIIYLIFKISAGTIMICTDFHIPVWNYIHQMQLFCFSSSLTLCYPYVGEPWTVGVVNVGLRSKETLSPELDLQQN
jgi:cytochrome c oxidase subunit IV